MDGCGSGGSGARAVRLDGVAPRPAGSPARPRPMRRDRSVAGARPRRAEVPEQVQAARPGALGAPSSRSSRAPRLGPTPRRLWTGARRPASASSVARIGAGCDRRAAELENRRGFATSLPIVLPPCARRELHHARNRHRPPQTPALSEPLSRPPGERPAVRQLRRASPPSLSVLQLDRYEALLEESDHDLFAWISGQQPVPERHDHDVFRLLQDLRLAEAGA